MPDLPPPMPHNRPRKPDNRLSASRRGYDRRWQKVRAVMLAKHPVCGCGNFTTQVHHLDNNPRNNSEDNLQPLCASCHSKITREQQR